MICSGSVIICSCSVIISKLVRFTDAIILKIGFVNILFQKINTPFQSGKDQHKFELNSCRNPVEIWQKSGDCEKEIVRENLVEAIPEVGGAKSSQSRGQFSEQIMLKRKVLWKYS